MALYSLVVSGENPKLVLVCCGSNKLLSKYFSTLFDIESIGLSTWSAFMTIL